MRRYKLEEKEFSEINITPFTDVVLVLLLIFMIASPLMVTGALKVKLPESTTSENTGEKSIEVFLNDKNQIYINDRQVNLDELQMTLQVEFLNKTNKEVIIKADKNALHGNFVQLLDALKKSGATKFLIATAKKD